MRAYLPLIVALLLLPLARAAAAQPVKVLHLKVAGAIDCGRMADDFEAELARALSDGVGFVLLELDGKAARPDVLWRMGRALRESGLPSAALLGSGPGASVGAGQVALGLLTDAVYLKPRTSIAAEGDAERALRALAPPGTDWERVRRELGEAVGAALGRRGGSADLVEVVVSPSRDLWAVESGSGLAVSPEPGQSSTRVVHAEAGELRRVAVDPVTAVSLKLVDGTAAGAGGGIGAVFQARGVTPAGRERRTIQSGLHSARTRAVRALREAAVEVQRIKAELNFRPRLDRTITDRDYRAAGELALSRIAALDAALADLDAALADYPELLVTEPSPRSTRPPADSIPGKLQAVRRDLEKHRAVAQEYATRR